MKKALKITGIVLVLLLIIILVAPVLFKGKIVAVANEQLENNLNAKASFRDINLSLIRNFPNLSVRIKELCVAGIDEFEGDTLLSINTVDITVDLISAIKMENIDVKKIIIDQPLVNAIVLESGKANWDIVPESEEELAEEDTATSEFTTHIALKLFKIADADIYYRDDSSHMKASLEGFNFILSGDLSQDVSSVKIDSEAEKLNFTMDGIRYLKNVLLKMHFDVDANLKESVYTLNENSVSLNALILKFKGNIEMPVSGDIITNLNFETGDTDFKTILSLVPAIYLTDYADLKTTGNLKLDGVVSGALTETANPNVDLKMLVKDASFSYPDLPKSAENINIDMVVHYDGVQMDNSTVDINKFHLDMGGNPVDLVLNLRTPVTDPFTNGKLAMSLDLETITDIIPLEETTLKGKIDANLDWMGKYSSIEKERYEEFKADGTIRVDELYYKSADVPKAVKLDIAEIKFTPKSVSIASLNGSLGNSDFRISGNVSNYIPYILKDETIKGELVLNAGEIDLNELMDDSGEEETQAQAAAEEAPLEVIKVPENIDFKFNSTIRKLVYDKLDIRDMRGFIYLREGRLVMENLSMKTLDGSLALSGEYNTRDIKNPLVDLKIDASGIDIPEAVKAFDILGKITPIANYASGKITVALSFSSLLQPDMTPVMNSISGTGRLASNTIGIKRSKAFAAIGQALKTDALNNLVLENIDLFFEIQNGTLHVKPFETKMGQVNMLIGGEQVFDKTMDYDIDLSAPRSLLGLENPAVNSLFNKAASKGVKIPRSETVNLKIKVTGELTDPKIKLDLRETAVDAVDEVKDQIKEEVREVIDEQKEEIREEATARARAEAEKIMNEAERQAAGVKSEAKKAADAVRSEANANANKLLNEAKNPLAKKAAEPAAKKIRDEGEAKARKIEREADVQANKILQEAQKKSDELLK